jgi:hypothetical protein
LICGDATPSIFILKAEEGPPASLILEIFSFWLLLLKTLKDCVIEPTFVKTVSKNKVSELVDTEASGLVINPSFVHEKKIKRIHMVMADFKLLID